EWLLDGPDPALDPALPRIDESGRKPGTSKPLDLGGGVKLELVWIPPGEFMMGSPTNEPGRSMTERLHRVKLTKGFWMGKYEATQEQWQRVMGNNPSWFQKAGPRAPVETVRRDQVQKFIRKLSELAAGKDGGKFRLPTEAEWEWACRAGATTALYNGKMTIKTGNNSPELSSIAWYAGNSGVDYEGGVLSTLWEDKEQEHHSAGTHPVGRKQPNAWGLYDMLGNVAEWCEDWNYAYPSKAVTDPTGPKKNMGDANMGEHVLRGGCWQNGVRICRSAARNWTVWEHGWRSATVGFRIVLEDSPAENAK
ncbi:MAG: formylglycine-generating enzyme family protein, partial [Planctomycetota bacterium]